MRRILALVLAATVTACASVSTEQSILDVGKAVGEPAADTLRAVLTEQDQARQHATVDELLKQPLDADAAVRVGLLNQAGVQGLLAELGVAQADLAQASKIENPGISFSRRRAGHDIEYERVFKLDILGLLFIPWRVQIEEQRLAAEKLRVAGEIGKTALDIRRAWIDAVAAKQLATYSADVASVAQAGASLAQRMQAAGNFSKLRAAREVLVAHEAQLAKQQADLKAQQAQAALRVLLGLPGAASARLQLPASLPELPKDLRSLSGSAKQAVASRLDIQLAQHQLQATAKALGLTKATRWVSALETSYLRDSDNEGGRSRGYELELAIPLFDWGEAKQARAESIYRASLHRLAERLVQAESELSLAHLAYVQAHQAAVRYREQVLPLRKLVSEENLLRYNGMLIGVFDLLADARSQVATVSATIEAQRAFWEMDARLSMATTVGSPGPGMGSSNQGVASMESAAH